MAAQSLKGKKRRKQRDPLKAKWIKAMEQAVVDTYEDVGKAVLTKQEAVVDGFLLMATHGRSRCSDLARVVEEPELDEDETGDP